MGGLTEFDVQEAEYPVPVVDGNAVVGMFCIRLPLCRESG